LKRRDFLGSAAVSLFAISRFAAELQKDKGTKVSGSIPYRSLGSTGEKVSCIGLGGYHLGQSHLEEADAIKLFHAAVDRGINFSDNSWDYNQGESERRVEKR
jgi:Aldo/keto reductase family